MFLSKAHNQICASDGAEYTVFCVFSIWSNCSENYFDTCIVLKHPAVLFGLTGTRGRDKGEFTNLQGISTSNNGRIVVADSNNQCIQVSVYHTLQLE